MNYCTIRKNPINNTFYNDIHKQNDIYNDNILPEVLTTFNELMAEKGEIENLKFLCYYHLIISSTSTSLISLDSFFVTDSDRRKSVIELEKIKNYYKKSLLLENEIKKSTVIIDAEKFEERMNINYQFNIIINEFWGYNEIIKFSDFNNEINEKKSFFKHHQSEKKDFNSNKVDSATFNDIEINNYGYKKKDKINIKNNYITEIKKINNDKIINNKCHNDMSKNILKRMRSKNNEIDDIIHKYKSSSVKNSELKESNKKIKENKFLNNSYSKNLSYNKNSNILHNKNLKNSSKIESNAIFDDNIINNNVKLMNTNNKFNKNKFIKNLKSENRFINKEKKSNTIINIPLSLKKNQIINCERLIKQTSIVNDHKKIKYLNKGNSQSKKNISNNLYIYILYLKMIYFNILFYSIIIKFKL